MPFTNPPFAIILKQIQAKTYAENRIVCENQGLRQTSLNQLMTAIDKWPEFKQRLELINFSNIGRKCRTATVEDTTDNFLPEVVISDFPNLHTLFLEGVYLDILTLKNSPKLFRVSTAYNDPKNPPKILGLDTTKVYDESPRIQVKLALVPQPAPSFGFMGELDDLPNDPEVRVRDLKRAKPRTFLRLFSGSIATMRTRQESIDSVSTDSQSPSGSPRACEVAPDVQVIKPIEERFKPVSTMRVNTRKEPSFSSPKFN